MQWEAQLQEPYTENQCKEHLKKKRPEIRREALKYKEQPKSYDAFNIHLQTGELSPMCEPRRIGDL